MPKFRVTTAFTTEVDYIVEATSFNDARGLVQDAFDHGQLEPADLRTSQEVITAIVAVDKNGR